MKEANRAAGCGQSISGELKIFRIGVDANQCAICAEVLGDCRCMTAAADRAVDYGLTRFWIDQLEDFGEQYRIMTVSRQVHCHRGYASRKRLAILRGAVIMKK